MKVWFKCDKCGEAFEAEERVRTDICPHCMSFIDLSRAERCPDPGERKAGPAASAPGSARPAAESPTPCSAAKENAPAAAESIRTPPPRKAEPGPGLAGIAPQGCPAGAEAEDTYESLYAKAEKMMSVGAWGNAAELFRHCLETRESWQARLGLVRAATRELTDLSGFADVQRDADAAFDKMTAAERLSLGKRYVPKLEEKRRSLCRSLDALAANEHFAAAPKKGILAGAESGLQGGPGTKKGGKGTAAIVVCILLMAVLFMIGTALMPEVGGAVFIILGLAVGVLGIVFGVRANIKEKRARAAHDSVQEIAENSRNAERAKIQAQIDAVDYLCGFFKY